MERMAPRTAHVRKTSHLPLPEKYEEVQMRNAAMKKGGAAGGIPPRRPRARARENGSSAVHRSAAPCSPTGFPRSTIGARRLSFRVRNGSGRAPPAMAADRWAALV